MAKLKNILRTNWDLNNYVNPNKTPILTVHCPIHFQKGLHNSKHDCYSDILKDPRETRRVLYKDNFAEEHCKYCLGA